MFLEVWIQVFQMFFRNCNLQNMFIIDFNHILIIGWSFWLLYDGEVGSMTSWSFVLFPHDAWKIMILAYALLI
jgi:hypothetical protein